MAIAVTMTVDIVKARLSGLEKLLNDLDGVLDRIKAVKERQGPQVWTSIPDCVSFADSYTAALRQLQISMVEMRRQVLSLQTDLNDTYLALGSIDTDVETRLAAVLTRLAGDTPSAPSSPPPSSPPPPARPAAPGGSGSW